MSSTPSKSGGKSKKAGKPKQDAGGGKAKTTEELLGIEAKKMEDFSEWYTQVITRSQMVDYYDAIRVFFDAAIKKLGVQNAYFPMFVSERSLMKEKDHVEGFAPEVAWVTRSGKSELKEPIALRPTSETIMYPVFAQWIRSHRDLPLKLNQWCNVVRWEFKHPTPFIRNREFLWQEGHTVFANKEEADKEVLDILDLYAQVYEKLLAVPVLKGRKSENEKFAGALYTTTVEAFVAAKGWAVQSATSHSLGQKFATMFGIEFENEKGGKQVPWQNSWGISTRSLGVMVMVHGDDKGLVLPPRAAPIQVVICPIFYKKKEENDAILVECERLRGVLVAAGLHVFLDDRTNYTPGWKYNHWEVKGVPVRLEVGPKDLANEKVLSCRRDTGAKVSLPAAGVVDAVLRLLDEIHDNMYARAKEERDSRIRVVKTMDEFKAAIQENCMCLAPWAEDETSEDKVKEMTAVPEHDGQEAKAGAKTLCIPFDQTLAGESIDGLVCFATGKPAKSWTLWGRSF